MLCLFSLAKNISKNYNSSMFMFLFSKFSSSKGNFIGDIIGDIIGDKLTGVSVIILLYSELFTLSILLSKSLTIVPISALLILSLPLGDRPIGLLNANGLSISFSIKLLYFAWIDKRSASD